MKNIYFIVIAAMAMIFCSCEEKDYSSFPPEWEGFRFERNGVKIAPTSVRAGDNIKVTAVQRKKGRLINGTDYKWTLKVPVYEADGVTIADKDSVMTYTFHTNYDGLDSGNPSWTFTVPSNAVCQYDRKANIQFIAEYRFSGNGVLIEFDDYNYNSDTHGSIVPSSGSTGGGAKGKVNIGTHNSKCGH